MTKRKLLQFKYRNWWGVKDGCGHQIAILPHFDVWWDQDYIDEIGNMRDDQIVVCFILFSLGCDGVLSFGSTTSTLKG